MTNGFTPLAPVFGVSADQLFADDVGSLLQQLEGKKPLPYIDTQGIPTVGIGFDLRVQANATDYFGILGITGDEQTILRQVFGATHSDTADLENDISTKLSAAGFGALPGLSDDQIETLWKDLVIGDANGNNPSGTPAYLPDFKKYMKENGVSSDILSSQDGLAIFSLYYNNKNTLIPAGSNLLKDLNASDFNRPDAWYQIRYGSNGGTPDGGIAKRRYEESRIFGLYDYGTETAPDLDEASAIYAELSADTNGHGMSNREWALQYENSWNSYISTNPNANANGDLAALQPMQPGETVQIKGLTVLPLDQTLQAASNALWQHYLGDVAINSFAQIYTSANNVDPLDVQVALAQGGSDLAASERAGYQLGQGAYQPSLLIAQGGSDTLDGSGSANDALIGGSGNDSFIVGDGNDYIVAGTGSALIGGPLSAIGDGSMGAGSDTIVLGDAQHAASKGTDTVWAGAGAETFYLAAGDSDVIHLNPSALQQPQFEMVGADGIPNPLDINATGLTGPAGVYLDQKANALVLDTQNSDGTESVKIIGLGTQTSAPQAMGMHALAEPAASPFSGVLELDGFQGDSDAGVTLNGANTTTPGAGNLGNFTATAYSDYSEYQDQSDDGGGDSMIGANTTGGNYNVLEGEGNAGYIYAGDGNNDVFADDIRNAPAWSQGEFSNPLNMVIQGGSGDQLLVGMAVEDGVGNGNETLIGGDLGQDSTAWTTIDGGGANVNALLVGGTQSSFILGGAGVDTIVAGSAAPASGQPAPTTTALAGLTFWAYNQQSAQGGGQEVVTGEPEMSIPEFIDPADFQIDISLDQLTVNEPVVPPDELGTSYGAPFGLLGSEWDTGTTVSMWYDNGAPMSLPGSLLIGGNGGDYLIGNSGGDTIIGGTPSNSVVGVIDEVLVGGGGANLIYGGAGNELIFADLSRGADTGWADLDPSDADTIYGGTGNEYIYGSGGNDVIYGGSGDYTINTGNGNAYVETGSGNTITNGGSGSDTIIAGSGVDSIATGDGNDSVYSGDGQSTISTGSGNDTFEAGSGTATYNAGTGVETYLIGTGAGRQYVQNSMTASGVNVNYVDGITSSDVTARDDTDGDLILTNQSTDSGVVIKGYFSDHQSNVSVSFSDGVTWDPAQILQASMTPSDGNDELIGSDGNDSITGGPGDDTIIGMSGNNVLTGGTGNSTIIGGSGADTIEGGTGTNDLVNGVGGTETYVFNLGEGPETISEQSTIAGADKLELGSGIDPSQVTFSHVPSNNQDVPDDDLLISLNDANNSTITIANFFEWWYGEDQEVHQIGAFTFADGTTLTASQVLAEVQPIVGTTGNDTLYGSSGPDVIDGKGGDDSVDGNGGSDTFVFNAGYGQLTISAPIPNFQGQGAESVLKLGAGITISNLVAKVATNGFSLTLTDGIAGDQITLQGFDFADNTDQYNTVEMVDLADGTALTKAQLIQMELADSATTGSDTLIGGPNADYIDGKGGGDYEEGFGGNDTLVFKSGYGDLKIDEQYSSGQNPVLQLGPGITTANLQVRTDGENLFLDDGLNGDEVDLEYMWQNGIATPGAATLDGVQAVQLADGTTLTLTQLAQMEAATGGTTGNDTLVGTAGADLLDGKGGSDSVVGGGGSDTFVYDAGYGQLEINEDYLSGQNPILQLGAGITAPALQVTSDGYDLLIADGISGDQIKLDGMVASGSTAGVEEVELADGSTLTRDQLLEMSHEISGTTGNDTLTGTPGADYFDGKGGSDLENGEGGEDTFVFNGGYGQLEVLGSENRYSQDAPSSIVMLGTGINESALHVTSNGMNLSLTDGISGDTVTLENTYTAAVDSGYGGATSVQLTDGTTLTVQQLVSMEISGGTTGNDSLYGTPGADYFDGKGGDDVETGDGGQDTYVFNPGYGQLTVDGSGIVLLGSGINESALRVTSNGFNLVLTDGISGDSITLWNGYPEAINPTASMTVQLSDGTVLDAAQLTSMAIADGTTGDDSLYGTGGADYFDGKGGDDVETGQGGDDTFVFNPGYGKLAIYDPAEDGGSSILKLGSGIDSASLNVSENELGDLNITDGIAGDQITIRSPGLGGGSSSLSNVQTIQFANGSTLTQDQLVQMASNLVGTTGSDYLVGTRGADLIDGKGGNDYELGNGGADTFVFNSGYGALEIGEQDGYTLQFGPGITSSNIVAWEGDGLGYDLILTDGVPGDVIRLDGAYFDATDNPGFGQVRFSDGTTLSLSQLVGEVQYYIYQGPETFRLGNESSNEAIGYESSSSTGLVNIYYADGITSTDVSVQGSEGGSFLLTNRLTGSTFTLVNYLSNLPNVTLTFSDGVTWNGAEILQESMTPDDGNDWLVGSDGNDTITGGPGNDTLVGVKGSNVLTGGTGNSTIEGGSGNDTIEGGKGTNVIRGGTGSETYLFNIGDGSDTITENTASSGTDTLRFGSGISASDSTFSIDSSNDLVVTFGAESASTVVVCDFTATGGSVHQIGTFQFANGVTYTHGQVLQMGSAPNLAGTAGNDLLVGASGADILDGKGGDDTAVGGGGSDTFVFDAGYGDLEINETYASGQQPVLRLGAGITESSLRVTADGNSLLLTDGIGGDQITLDNENVAGSEGVALVQLADGTTLSTAQLVQMSHDIYGTTADDTLTGTSGPELIDGRGGNDSVRGNGGSDTFVFNSGYGDLEINESYTSGQQPVLQLGAGITASALHLVTDGTNFMLTDGVSGDQITLDGMWSTPGDGIAAVQLADGTTLTASQLIQLEMTGTSGNDTIYGTAGSDSIDGKGGSDSVFGGGGSDTFVFNSGYGHLEVDETYTSGQQAVLELGAGIAASSLQVAASGNNLVLTDGAGNDQITLDDEADAGYGIAIVHLADGTTLTQAQLIQMSRDITGTTGNDTLTGTSGAELIDGKGGNDSITGDGGSDTLVFDSGYGNLTINEHYTSGQQPVLQLGSGITAASLSGTKSGNDLVLADGVSGDQITLYDMWSSSTYGVATAQLADGTTLTRSQLIQLTMTGTTGNDTLTGTAGDDLFDGKGGTDSITGGGGNDTIVFDSGYGNLTINEHYISGQQPVLQLGSGITATSLSATKSGNNLVLADGVGGDQITLYDMWSSSTYGVASAQLADGTTLTRSQLIQLEMIGTTGNDTLTGTSGADLFDGKGGTDSVIGAGGNDTIVFDSGYGPLTINESYTSGQQPVLKLGAGITTAALRVTKSGNNLVLSDGVSGDQVTLYDMWSSSTYGVAKAQLADGTVLTRSQLFQLEMTGTPGNDTIYGTSGADLIDGKGGSDSVTGSGGNDTFVFNSGYGHLAINESFTSGQTPVLKLGTGITASALRVTSNGTNLLLSDGISGDQVTLDKMWTSDIQGVATVKLASGTTFTRSQLMQMEMTGTSGNDTLYGTSGDDLIDGKGGSDSIIGGGGNDTFVFNSGYGHLVINETFTSGQAPVLKLGTGITASTLIVKTSGSNLLLTDGASGDQITLDTMVTSSTKGVATVQLADGTVLTRSQLIGMEAASVVALASPSTARDGGGGTALTDEVAGDSVPLGGPSAYSDSGASEAKRDDTSVPASLGTSNLTAGDSTSPSQDAVVGAGTMRLPATMPSDIPSAGGTAGSDLQQSRAASHTDAPAGQSPIADAQTTSQPGAAGTPPSSASNDTDQYASALPPMSVPDTHLGSFSFPAQAQPESDVMPTPGAPADPLMNDPDDLGARSNLPLAIGGGKEGAPGAVSAAGWKTAFAPAFGQRQAMRTAGAVDGMVKALSAQGGMRTSRPWFDSSADSPDQIRLQGGAMWSLSAVDRTLAALSPAAGVAGGPSSRLTDLAHAQLVSAMASFSPMASAASSPLLSPTSEAYAIAVAVPMQ